MIRTSDKYLLMIEPHDEPKFTEEDLLYRQVKAIYDKTKPVNASKGIHRCTGFGCKTFSDNYDHVLPNGIITNSLALHYVQYHRSEIPSSELAKITKVLYDMNLWHIK